MIEIKNLSKSRTFAVQALRDIDYCISNTDKFRYLRSGQ
jgi:hypothetical protein